MVCSMQSLKFPYNQHKQPDRPSAARCCGRYGASAEKWLSLKLTLVMPYVNQP
jgi:hypothetical protein